MVKVDLATLLPDLNLPGPLIMEYRRDIPGTFISMLQETLETATLRPQKQFTPAGEREYVAFVTAERYEKICSQMDSHFFPGVPVLCFILWSDATGLDNNGRHNQAVLYGAIGASHGGKGCIVCSAIAGWDMCRFQPAPQICY